MPKPLSPTRRWCRPSAGDSLESIAERDLAEIKLDEAVTLLRTWNPHLGRGRRDYRLLLVSDVVFLEGLPGEEPR